jgi:hypothetical protein
MKTIAKQLIASFDNFTDCLIAANKQAVNDEQDFDAEITVLTFEDGSKLRFDGSAQQVEQV